MNLLPYRKVIIKTTLKREEALIILRKAVFTKQPSPFYIRGPFDYYARFKGNRFIAYRLLDNMRSNGFNPGIHGHFILTPDGTEIHVHIYPPVVNILFTSILIFVFVALFFNDLVNWFIAGQSVSCSIVFVLIPIILYFFMVEMFSPEAKRAEQFLNGLFKT